MKCFVHHDIDASGSCSNCGKGVCKDCDFIVSDKHLCKKCYESTCSITINSKDAIYFVTPVTIILNMGEVEAERARASLFKGLEAVGGFIIITNQRLIHASHTMNIQSDPTYIPLADIVDAGENLRLLRNQIYIKTKAGKKHVFVVYPHEKKRLIEAIKSRITK